MSSRKTVVYYSLIFHCPSYGPAHIGYEGGIRWGESKEDCDRRVIDELLELRPDAVKIFLASHELPQDKLPNLPDALNTLITRRAIRRK